MAHRTRCCIFTILNLKFCSVMADARVPYCNTVQHMCDDTRLTRLYTVCR